jgi:hypothetical protein
VHFSYFMRTDRHMCPSTCMPSNNFWTNWWNFLILGMNIMPLEQCSQAFFTCGTPKFVKDRWWHTTKFCLMKRGYETIHGKKYVSAYKFLPKKKAGIWKQNNICLIKLSMMNQCVCVCIVKDKILHFSNYNVQI